MDGTLVVLAFAAWACLFLRLGPAHVCKRHEPVFTLVFSLLASSLGLPAAILLISWLGTLWSARLQLNLRCCSPLVSFHSSWRRRFWNFPRTPRSRRRGRQRRIHHGHFHLVNGRRGNVRNPRALVFSGFQNSWPPPQRVARQASLLAHLRRVYLVFMPMHWLGLLTRANLYSGSGIAAIAAIVAPVRAFITVAAILLVIAQGIFS